jgi:SagB-type dehydrogenase family enzyme
MQCQPRIVKELVLVPFAGGLMVDGTHQLHVLRGEGISRVLPQLMSLMDGKRTTKDLERDLPDIPAEELHDVLAVLFRWGVIEDMSEAGDPSDPESATLGFIRRYLNSTGANRNSAEAYARLCSINVAIVTDSNCAEASRELQELLKSAGMAKVSVLTGDAFVRRDDAAVASPWGLLVSIDAEGDEVDYEGLDRRCQDGGVPWLRAAISKGDGYADVGPLFGPLQNSCYRCFQRMHSPLSKMGGRPTLALTRSTLLVWIGFVATEVIYLSSQIGSLLSDRGCTRFDISSWQSRLLHCTAIPDCARCQPLGKAHSVPAPGVSEANVTHTAYVYEDYVSRLPGRRASRIKDEQQAALVERLTRETKSMPNSPAYSLPAGDPPSNEKFDETCDEDSSPNGGKTTASQLAFLLKMAAGIHTRRAGNIRRWPPTAGNLGSVEIFVVARNVTGLSPGVYLYQPHDHSLARFQQRGDMVDIDAFMCGAIATDQATHPDALIVFTGAYHRLYQKYKEFAYKLLYLDAGAAMSQFQFAAAGLGLDAYPCWYWADDFLEVHLNLEGFEEHCTMAVALTRQGLLAEKAPPMDIRPRPIIPSFRPIQEFREITLQAVTELLHRESRMTERLLGENTMNGHSVPSNKDRALFRPPYDTGTNSPGDIEQLLLSRRSTRRFNARKVTNNQLLGVLHTAHRWDTYDCPLSEPAGELEFIVLARAVDGSRPGVYSYSGTTNELSFGCDIPSVEDSKALFVHDVFAMAPVVIWIVGDLATACGREGALGHRHLLLRAGAAANRMWLAALRSDLSGTIVAGIVRRAAQIHFGLNGLRQCSLVAFAMGYARSLVPPSGIDQAAPCEANQDT